MTIVVAPSSTLSSGVNRTALNIIERAMRLIKVLGQNETPTAKEAEDGLESLNSLLDALWLERLMVFQIVKNTYTWPASTTSRTIGPSGSFDTTRPVKIDSCYFTLSGIDYPCGFTEERRLYDDLSSKTVDGIPSILFADTGFALTTLYAYPRPSEAMTLNLKTWAQLQIFQTLTELLSLPPGYERLLCYNLAVEFAPEFGVDVPPTVERIALQSKGNVKRINTVIPTIVPELAYLGRGVFNITTG